MSLLLGGGTRQGLWSDAAVQLVSLALLAVSLRSLPTRDATRLVVPAVIVITAVAVPLMQLFPLPFEWWTNLPGRSAIAEIYREIGATAPWLTVSLDPRATERAIISLIPAIAVFLAVIQLGHGARRSLSLLFVAVGVVSVVVGLAQLMQGADSPLRFYPITNPNQSVGFFANRNHYAALLYSVVPITAAWLVGLTYDRRPERWFGLVVCSLTYVALILGLAMAQSRAGVLLALLCFAGSLLIAGSERGRTATRTVVLISIVFAAGLVAAVQYAFFGVLARFDDGVVDQFRLVIDATTATGARSFQPIGSGLGTFVPVYQMFEQPGALLTTYVNHAHNDWFELWLEGGWPVLGVLALFVAWFAFSVARIWRGQQAERPAIDRTLARAACVVIVALLLHSAVDYPLRTTALMTLFAFCCALLVEPISPSSWALLTRTSMGDWRERFERRRRSKRRNDWSAPRAAR